MPTYTDAEYIKKRTLAGHSYDNVLIEKKNTDVAFVDNDTLISGGKDGKRIAWNVKTGMQLWNQETPGTDVFNVAVPSLDPSMFVYNDGNYIIKICSTKTGELEREIDEYTTGNIGSRGIMNITFRPNSHIFASGRTDGTIRFWNADNLQHIRTLSAHGGTSLAWSSYTRQIIASGHSDGTVELVYLNSGNFDDPMKSFYYDKIDAIRYGSRFRSWVGLDSLRDYRVTVLAFNPSGLMLASGHGDGNIILWNVATQQKLQTLLGHTTRVPDHEWSPDGTHLASAQSVSQNIRLWKLDTGENFGILRMDTHVSSIAFSPDSQTLASGDTISGDVTIWERTN